VQLFYICSSASEQLLNIETSCFSMKQVCSVLQWILFAAE
jgi:hypothetical protein